MLSNTFNDERTNNFLEHLMNLSYNRKCADCNKKQPSWVTLTYSFFICYECAGRHRNLGVLKSKVKSTQMDSWCIDDLRRMYVGGNKNIHRIPPNQDFSLKYHDCRDFLKELDELVAKSEKAQPGDSFMNVRASQAPKSTGNTIIKKKQKLKFSDVIDETAIEDINTEDDSPGENISKRESASFAMVNEDKSDEKEEDALQRVSKPTTNLKKSLKASRSPFSFSPKEIDEQDE